MKNKHIHFRTLVIVTITLCVGLLIIDMTCAPNKQLVDVSAKQLTYYEPAQANLNIGITPLDINNTVDNPPMPMEPIKVEPTSTPPYTEEELDLFSRLLYAEMGASWVEDEIQMCVGSVVLNRMESDLFPDTLYEVIYQDGQYSPTWNGAIDNIPDERTIENARKLLNDGSILPEDVVFQANFKQGSGVYSSYHDSVLGTTTYFCYASN